MHYPSLYEREAWHYQKPNVDQIRKVISEFRWDNHFSNINVNEQVQLCNQIIRNIISNYIPDEAITFDDRHPPRIDGKIKSYS